MESGEKDTLKRLILGELADAGPLDDEAICDRLVELYRRAGIRFPWLVVDDALWSLICGRRITKRPGRWEGQFWYSIRRRSVEPRQEVLCCIE